MKYLQNRSGSMRIPYIRNGLGTGSMLEQKEEQKKMRWHGAMGPLESCYPRYGVMSELLIRSGKTD